MYDFAFLNELDVQLLQTEIIACNATDTALHSSHGYLGCDTVW